MKAAAPQKRLPTLRASGHLTSICFGASLFLFCLSQEFCFYPSLRCKCELCAPYIAENSPQASDDLGDSSDSDDSQQEASVITNLLPDAVKCTEHEGDQLRIGQPNIDPETAAATLRLRKREAIRKAVEAQRSELDGSQKR